MSRGAEKRKLMNMFRIADISSTFKIGKDPIKNYPSIVKVEVKKDYKRFVFRLPVGLNPTDFSKKTFIIDQTYGSNYELDSKGNMYCLTVHSKVRSMSNKYDFNEYDLSPYKIPIVAGKDRNGNSHIYDMVKYPHLLLAGETGSGKSTQLRAILATLILSKKNVHLYLADLKRSEFHLFKRIEKVKEVVHDVSGLSRIMSYLSREMERRGELLDEAEVMHIDDLENPPPYIILCIDEVALLKKEKALMGKVEDVSAIGRALGIFLILSMQRPDKDVLDGKLKNNLTVRMAFAHADKINSDITLGRGSKYNAEKLKEPGRMYFKNKGVMELQAPLLEADPAKKLLQPYKVEVKNTELQPVENEEQIDIPVENIFGVLGGNDNE
ncbi:FtsK/SpoIIIE domain-containing protein [Alkalihalobacillus macyae]|uniref:FtsK/SpoIIIE domain-containing protein n=1 Tax=Guptibacillus hwajinpoensis TaxID=208199 RepID=UPI00273CE8F5|nr:FtsK/SpoIIIE domain-containing protein [Alkalihalobacillus macyae]MDP4549869.1 FtsK/SpoIIIE domain-containing protein [Alkalihalobacillus macyae]